MIKFRDREDAGRQLALELQSYATEEPIVLALPRGGVPVGFEIAQALSVPLDIWVVRKLGVPWHPELGVGAVAEGGYVHVSRDVLRHVGISEEALTALVDQKTLEVVERVRRFREGRPPPELGGRTVILVDDGIATGGTMHAAIQSIRAQKPRKLILAVPVAAPATIEEFSAEVEQIHCLMTPHALHAIGLWYEDFTQTADEEVVALLHLSRQNLAKSEHVGV